MKDLKSVEELQQQGFEVNCEIVFSTAHLSKECANALREESSDEEYKAVLPLLVYPHDMFGFRIFVPEDKCFETDFPELNHILTFAQEHKVDWVLFDCDGLLYKQFPAFGW